MQDRRRVVEEIARLLQNKYSREGLSEFLGRRLGVDVDPEEIKHKGAYLEALLLDLPPDKLKDLAQYLGVRIDTATVEKELGLGSVQQQGNPLPLPANSETTKTPESWPGFVFWLASSKKRLLIALIVALAVGIVLVGAGRLAGYDVFASVFPRLAKVKVNQLGSPGLQLAIDEARRRDKAYVILSATQLAEIRDSIVDPSSGQARRDVTVRTVYTLLMLKDVARTENTEFFEAYTSDNRAVINRWYGTERETSDASGSSYDVLFDAKAGETHTVVTGAVYSVNLPLPSNRSAFGQNTSLAENEDTWGYPNVIDGDVIHEMTIVIWSPTTKLIPVGQAAKRLTNRTVKGADVYVNESSAGTDVAQRSLSAHWYNIMPNEEVGIHFAWPT